MTINNKVNKKVPRYKKSLFLSFLFALTTFIPTASGNSPFYWYTLNIPPFGSKTGVGIGYELVNAYIEAGLKNKIVLTNVERWHKEMTDTKNNTFCSSGSWKLPGTSHRIYSSPIINTVDYGIAVRPEIVSMLGKKVKANTVSIQDIIDLTKLHGSMMVLKGRPIFGEINRLVNENKHHKNVKIRYMTASEGSITMLRMANVSNRDINSVLIFPEEFTIFENQYPDHSLRYLMLTEGGSFAPIRASCPITIRGKQIIAQINKLLDEGLRDKAFSLFQHSLPDIDEIKKKAIFNQLCIKSNSCIDPLMVQRLEDNH